MRVLIYHTDHLPDKEAKATARSLEQSGDRVSFRTADLFEGIIEDCDVVYAASEAVREAYEEAGVEVNGFGGLPDDFPGREALLDDGRFVTAGEAQDASEEELASVDGVGPATIDKIKAYAADE